MAHSDGVIGLPHRLLAREVYDKVVAIKGAANVALVTGEEKITPPQAAYFVCTVEAMPLNRSFQFLAVDEIQLAADPERGHVFTDRLLHARGLQETMFMGSDIIRGWIQKLIPRAQFMKRERFSELTYKGSKKISRLPSRSAIVTFSTNDVYAIAELVRRQRGGAAVVMGSLSPRAPAMRRSNCITRVMWIIWWRPMPLAWASIWTSTMWPLPAPISLMG